MKISSASVQNSSAISAQKADAMSCCCGSLASMGIHSSESKTGRGSSGGISSGGGRGIRDFLARGGSSPAFLSLRRDFFSFLDSPFSVPILLLVPETKSVRCSMASCHAFHTRFLC